MLSADRAMEYDYAELAAAMDDDEDGASDDSSGGGGSGGGSEGPSGSEDEEGFPEGVLGSPGVSDADEDDEEESLEGEEFSDLEGQEFSDMSDDEMGDVMDDSEGEGGSGGELSGGSEGEAAGRNREGRVLGLEVMRLCKGGWGWWGAARCYLGCLQSCPSGGWGTSLQVVFPRLKLCRRWLAFLRAHCLNLAGSISLLVVT